jgi:CheY-like chemotaxis protein
VSAASDGIAGLSQAAQRAPAVVLLDIMMPDLGGMGVLHEMAANPALADVPVLVLTGHLDAIPALQEQLGRDRVFPKPFGVADLLSRIAELTGKAPTA